MTRPNHDNQDDQERAASPEGQGDAGDQALLRRVSAGDDDALRELYRIHGQHLYAYALRTTGDAALAEDVVQESLIAVWKNAGGFRGEGRVIAWMLRIVHNRALNAIRGRKPESWDAQTDDVVDDTSSPDELLMSSERRYLLRATMEQLSVKHRTTLELVFFQGLSLQEAALVCDCPVGTIKSRLSYAKSRLRSRIRPQGLLVEDNE